MNHRLLIISGPTAAGKTALAVKIAQKFNGELISADSRQIYRGLNIGVGKDHPKNTLLHLIDLINPDETFSAAQFQKLALKVIEDIHHRGKLPILVGGTGLYIDSVINPRPTFAIKPNKFLRFFLNRLPLKLLQSILYFLDLPAGRHGFQTFRSLNNSDRNNPYRLIRKIEIRLSRKHEIRNWKLEIGNFLHLSLTAPNQFIYRRIDTRVEERLKLGHIDELKYLLTRYSWNDPGLKVSAYASFRPFFQQQKSFAECVADWKNKEHRDARHQKTWFKSRPGLKFIDISKKNFNIKIIRYLNQWLNG